MPLYKPENSAKMNTQRRNLFVKIPSIQDYHSRISAPCHGRDGTPKILKVFFILKKYFWPLQTVVADRSMNQNQSPLHQLWCTVTSVWGVAEGAGSCSCLLLVLLLGQKTLRAWQVPTFLCYRVETQQCESFKMVKTELQGKFFFSLFKW